ncbi:DNA-directed RNA polymerase sigma-24 subunit [Gracilibacillus halophilus YIM-C55.5]|uniref:DNA-directed RNA polymerase sigma-24 subunit n=1 Tax=Gracilibacillus halophilus YIM-C55.5 TaxID=1308866 RepID=N4WT29_9BACI|nr:sigma-70 family RNA polymerase sigma factor [Gracilibacillus halophilus]ENH96326.1 DNA-directed RNA polymerase sigma-24 subunit [Gracilibacillus halophilus YIM-C55.5]
MEELVEQYRDQKINKNELIQRLMDRFGSQLTRLAYTYVKDVQIAENIIQEVFIICYRKIDTLKKNHSIHSWLNQITVNKCRDYFRSRWFKEKHTEAYVTTNLRSDHATPEQQLTERLEHDQLTQEVLALPIKYREVIICFYYHDFSLEETSDILKVKKATISTRLRRGRHMLREKLGGNLDEA